MTLWSKFLNSLDATYTECLGRFINDDPAKKANATMKKIIYQNEVHWCVFAKKNISKNEEIRYDYGVKDLPWRESGNNLIILIILFEPCDNASFI